MDFGFLFRLVGLGLGIEPDGVPLPLEFVFAGVVFAFDFGRGAACEGEERALRWGMTGIVFCLARLSTFFAVLTCFAGVTGTAFGLAGENFRFLPSASWWSSSEDEDSAPAKSSEESEAWGPPPS